jgi:hypothetical protein
MGVIEQASIRNENGFWHEHRGWYPDPHSHCFWITHGFLRRATRPGTLHGGGTFGPLGPPMNPIKVRPDGMSIGVGVKMASAPFPGWPA